MDRLVFDVGASRLVIGMKKPCWITPPELASSSNANAEAHGRTHSIHARGTTIKSRA